MKLCFALVAAAALALVLVSAEEEDGLDWKLDFSCGDLFYRTMHLSQNQGEGENDEEVRNYISRNVFFFHFSLISPLFPSFFVHKLNFEAPKSLTCS